MKHEFVLAHRFEHTVKKMCEVLKVNESGFYKWINRPKSKRKTEDEALVIKIRQIHEESKKVYGPTRIQRGLENHGISCGLGRIRRLMRENGIYSITKYKYKPFPKEHAETRFSDNIVDQNFGVDAPNKLWVGDITYIKADTGWVYLAVVIDLFNREVIGYSTSAKANSELTKRAMAQALAKRRPNEAVLFHSDRGTQYSSKAYCEYLSTHNIASSMSRAGCPYDNACAESFFATIKKEWIFHRHYKNIEEIESSLFEYIELFYNRKRMHTRLDNVAPIEYYNKYQMIICA